MSSEDEDISSRVFTSAPVSDSAVRANKKRKILARACDVCRRKKIKCDANTDGVKCTTCTVHQTDCTFVETSTRRGPPKGYLDYLESRIDRLEAELKRLLPGYDIVKSIGRRFSQASWTAADQHLNPASRSSRSIKPSQVVPLTRNPATPPALVRHESSGTATPSVNSTTTAPNQLGFPLSTRQQPLQAHDTLESSEDEGGHTISTLFETSEDDLAGQLSQLRLGKDPFLGKASGLHLLLQAKHMKSWATGQGEGPGFKTTCTILNKEFWGEKRWGNLSAPWMPSVDTLVFPPRDLLNDLIALYFCWFHPFFPTLHQPTFEAQLKRETHKKDLSYALQVLLVCAVASRWSEDPRVCEVPDSVSSTAAQVDWKVAGWPFFVQVIHFPLAFNHAAQLLDLQNTVLYCYFAMATQATRSMWLASGAGVRCAMDIGAHRRKSYDHNDQLQNELWKRTFWCLVNIDRMTSGGLGRPPATNDEDVDAELPLEVDDSYWDNPIKQIIPNGEPTHMQFFNHTTKLLQITAFAMRTIYSITKSRVFLGFVGHDWETRIVAELDSALNNWFDTMPGHLRWGTPIENPAFYEQSVNINIRYYNAQIVIHRRFLPRSDKKVSSLSYSSMAMCTNAARSMSHIMDDHLKRILASQASCDPSQRLVSITPNNVSAAFLGGIVLLIAIWRLKRNGGHSDVGPLAEDFQKIMEYVKYAETRLHVAAHAWDMLHDLAGERTVNVCGAQFPLPAPGRKRTRSEARSNSGWDHDSAGRNVARMPYEAIPSVLPPFTCGTDYLETSGWSGTQWLSEPALNAPVSAAEAGSTLPEFDPSIVNFDVMDIGDLLNSTLNYSHLFQPGGPFPWPSTSNMNPYGAANGDPSMASYLTSPCADGLESHQATLHQPTFPTNNANHPILIPGMEQAQPNSSSLLARDLPQQDCTPHPCKTLGQPTVIAPSADPAMDGSMSGKFSVGATFSTARLTSEAVPALGLGLPGSGWESAARHPAT